MEQVNYVEFKKERYLGAIISDTFKFIRLEYKPFFTTILKVSILPILLAVASFLYYSFAISNTFSSFGTNNGNPNFIFFQGGEMFLSIFLFFIFYILAYVTISLAGFYYIKSYIDNRGNIDQFYIKQKVKEKFWSFLGLGFLIAITMLTGFIFCFLPGIYFYVVFSMAFPLMVFAEEGVFDAYGESFNFLKGHWWETFGCVIVVGILVTILGYIFSIPAIIYQLVNGFISLGTDPAEVFSMFSDPVYILLEIISYIGRFLFLAVTIIATVFIYFDVNEQKNATGTFEKIDNLGN